MCACILCIHVQSVLARMYVHRRRLACGAPPFSYLILFRCLYEVYNCFFSCCNFFCICPKKIHKSANFRREFVTFVISYSLQRHHQCHVLLLPAHLSYPRTRPFKKKKLYTCQHGQQKQQQNRISIAQVSKNKTAEHAAPIT